MPLLLVAACIASSSGCAARYAFHAVAAEDAALATHEGEASDAVADVRRLPMFAARQGGTRIGWTDLLAAVRWADVVIIGEQHDDARGHEVQLAVVEDVLRDASPGSVALSMEMLERDDQPIVDDYCAGLIDIEEFIDGTDSAGWPDWLENYQPIVDAAKAAGAPVIAANAPRRYVRLARTRGYEFLGQLTPAQRALFALPQRAPSNEYRARFFEVMTHADDDEPDVEQESRAAGDDEAASPAGAHGRSGETAGLESALRSQLVWDATMGQSIARALRQPRVRRVIHLVGQFHSDLDGGTVQMLRASSSPWFPPRVLTISLQRRPIENASLLAEDLDRADIVIHTGEPPPDEEAPADQDETIDERK